MTKFTEEYRESFVEVSKDRDYMYQQLQKVPGLKTYPSKCNFLFSELPVGVSGKYIRNVLLEKYGLVIRECSNKVGSTESYLRNVVRRKEDTDKLVFALSEVLSSLMRLVQPNDTELVHEFE